MGTKREDRVDGSGALTAARQWLSMDCSHPGCSSTVLQAAQRLKNQANTKSMTRNLRIKPAPSAWPSVYSSSRPYLKHSVNFHSVLLQVPDAKGLTLQWATHGVRSGTALSFTHSYFDHKRRFAELFVCRTDSAWLITTPLPSLMHILPALMHRDHHCWPISSLIILPRSCQQPGNKRKPAEKMNEQKYQDPVPSYPLLSGWGHNCHLEKQLPWRCERNMITTLRLFQNLWEWWKFCWVQSLLSNGLWKMFVQQVCWRWNTNEMGNFINSLVRVSVQQKRSHTEMQKLVCLKQTKECLLKSHEFLYNCYCTWNTFLPKSSTETLQLEVFW